MPQVNGINCPRNLFISDDYDYSLDDKDTSDDDNHDVVTIDNDDDEIINHSLPASGFGTINTWGSTHPYIRTSCLLNDQNHSINFIINQSINQSIDQSINQSYIIHMCTND